MNSYRFATVLTLACLLCLPVQAANWSAWEQQHAVARQQDFLVIRDPADGSCYLKQSYYGEPEAMELVMASDGVPILTTPYYAGIEGDVVYAVDQGAERRLGGGGVSVGKSLALPRALVPQLKAGWTLRVRVQPVGQPPREQQFSLKGFTAAARRLHTKPCR